MPENIPDNKTILMEQFARTARLVHRYKQYSRQNCSPFSDASQGQGRVLALLNIQPEMSQKELGYLLGIRNQSISELVSKLEKAGYVTKTPSESDKRVMNIKLTEKGKEAASQMNTQTKEIGDIFDCLDPEEQATFASYLGRINTEIEHELGEEGTAPFGGQGNPFEHFRAMFERHGFEGAEGFDGFRGGRGPQTKEEWQSMHEKMAERFGGGFGADFRDCGVSFSGGIYGSATPHDTDRKPE